MILSAEERRAWEILVAHYSDAEPSRDTARVRTRAAARGAIRSVRHHAVCIGAVVAGIVLAVSGSTAHLDLPALGLTGLFLILAAYCRWRMVDERRGQRARRGRNGSSPSARYRGPI